jgi:hypothetical protein
MYACIRRIGRGFFEVVCAPSNSTAIFHDPPPPGNIREPEHHCQGSRPKKITSRSTVGGALAWGRGKPSPARCPSTTRKLPKHHAQCRRHSP